MNKLKILSFFMILSVFSMFGLGAAQIVGTIPAQTKAEDASAWTLDLTTYENGTAGETDAQLTWTVSDVDTSLFTIGISSKTDVATFTPVSNANGADTVTFTLTDGTNTVTQNVFITLNAENDAPVISTIDDQEIQEDVESTYQVSASDVDGDTLTYALVTAPTDMIITSTGLISWTPTNPGKEIITVKATDTSGASDNETFDFLVGPDLCGNAQIGDIRIDKFDIEDGDDDFYPGDKVIVEVEIENEYSSSDEDGDVEDIVVEVILYDLDDGDELDDIEADTFDLDAGEDENDMDDFELEIPSDADDGNEIRVYALVYEDGNKDVNCRFESEEIDLKRKKHDVTVEDYSLLPSVANPGDTITVKIQVENVGSRNEDDVIVRVFNSALGVDETSNEFDLDKYSGSDNDHKLTFTFTVPENAQAGTYSIEIDVRDEDGDTFDSGSEFNDLTISSSGSVVDTDGDLITSLSILSFDSNLEQGGSVSIPVKVTNDGTSIKQYTLEVVNIDDWADPVSSKTVSVGSGQTTTEYLFLNIKEGVEGKHSATVNVKSGNEIVATQSAVVEVIGEGEGVVGRVTGWFGENTTLLWILGDVVLIVLAIWFIKMLFVKKH